MSQSLSALSSSDSKLVCMDLWLDYHVVLCTRGKVLRASERSNGRQLCCTAETKERSSHFYHVGKGISASRSCGKFSDGF